MAKRVSNEGAVPKGQQFPFKKTLLAMCVGAAIQPAAWAQTETTETSANNNVEAEVLEEILVYGVRSSLKSAQDIKKNADTHLDAISASDLGALPDVSVLEALQRVPGVSIERFAAANDPDHFSTEGSGVTLRGLPNTRTEFNGRDTFSASNGRGLSFEDVSPELLGSVEIFKNQTADMIEGGISGTINLNTFKPFDSDDRVFNVSAQANYGDLEEELTPSFSGLYSDRWEVDGGEFGVRASYSNSDLDFRSDGAQFGFHRFDEASGRYTPLNAGIRTTSTNRQREGASLALQYENTDKTFSALVEYLRSESDTDWLERAFFSDDAAASPSSNVVYGANGVFVGGTLEGADVGLGPQTRRSDESNLTQDLSLSLSFQATDRLAINADIQYVDSEKELVDLSVFGGIVGGGINIDLARNGDTPVISFRAPNGSSQSDAEFFSDPNNYYWRAAMDHIEESEGDEAAVRLDFEYELESGFAKSVQAGVRWSERDQTTRWSTYNWGNVSDSWNGGEATFGGIASGNGFQSTEASAFSFGDFHNGVGGLPGGVGIFADASTVTGFDNFQNTFGNVRHIPGLSSRDGAVGNYLPAEVNSTTETNTSAYIRLNFGSDGDNRLGGNVGLRYINQDTSVKGGIVFPSINLPDSVDRTALPAEITSLFDFANGFSSNEDAESSFDKILPSLNIKYEITPELIARFGASQAVAYPDLGNLRYNYNISIDIDTDGGVPEFNGFRQISGNPFLEPLESNNFDLSLEYYFDDADYVAAGVFHKDMKNFFSTTTSGRNVTNPSTGATQVVEISQPFNVGEATLSGFEFSYQQFFDELPGVWSGLGVQFNYTYLDPSAVPQQNLRPDEFSGQSDADRAAVPYDNLPLQGLSENQFNLVGLFQNDKWEGRLAYNWRDDYLLTIREVNSSNVGFDVTTFADARGQLDGSVFYKVNDDWQVGLQGSNLLQDEVVTSSQVDASGTRVLRHSYIFDRRLTFVVRGSF